MIVVSLYVRGIGGALKQLALKIMLPIYKLDVDIFQKTMSLGSKAIEILSSLLKDWRFDPIDVVKPL